MRTPLSLIVGYAEIVRDINWPVEKERNDNLNLIIDEATRLNNIVKDILDYSQLQSGFLKLNKASCCLDELVEAVVDYGSRIGSRYGIAVELRCPQQPVDVISDAAKMTQVLRNLMNNAINHTKDSGRVTATLRESEPGIARVEVANPGSPIPAESRHAIWERYQRVQHQGGRHEGSGIGLSLVSGILLAHGFCYGVEYADGNNIFWLEIPIQSRI